MKSERKYIYGYQLTEPNSDGISLVQPSVHRWYQDEPFPWSKKQTPHRAAIHETAGGGYAVDDPVQDDSAERTLRAKGCSTHLMLGMALDFKSAVLAQHNPLDQQLVHGGALNKDSVGIDVVNPYYPHELFNGEGVIHAAWAHKKKYTLPYPEQMQALHLIVQELWQAGLLGDSDAPINFPAVKGSSFMFGPFKGFDPNASGVIAHSSVPAHADGGFPVLFLYLCQFLRWDQAYEEAVIMAESASSTKAYLGSYTLW